MIWVDESNHGRPPERLGIEHGFMTRDDIPEHLQEVERNLPGVNSMQLNPLLRVLNNRWAVMIVVLIKLLA